MTLWEHLAAFAWEQHLTEGKGVVLAEHDELLAAAARVSKGESSSLWLGYIGASEVPPGDDFLKIILESDPKKQVLLLVRHGESDREEDEQLYLLEPAESGRPSPQECYRQIGNV